MASPRLFEAISVLSTSTLILELFQRNATRNCDACVTCVGVYSPIIFQCAFTGPPALPTTHSRVPKSPWPPNSQTSSDQETNGERLVAPRALTHCAQRFVHEQAWSLPHWGAPPTSHKRSSPSRYRAWSSLCLTHRVRVSKKLAAGIAIGAGWEGSFIVKQRLAKRRPWLWCHRAPRPPPIGPCRFRSRTQTQERGTFARPHPLGQVKAKAREEARSRLYSGTGTATDGAKRQVIFLAEQYCSTRCVF